MAHRSRNLHPAARALPCLALLLLLACSAKAPPAGNGPAAAQPGTDAGTTAAVAPGSANAVSAARPLSPAQALMKQLDRDGDGRLSREEHAFQARKAFASMDTNFDGKVSVEELDAVRKQVVGDNRSASTAAIAIGDANRDGVLSAEEHATATRVAFDSMDTDHDGYLTVAELEGDQPAR